MVAGDEELMRRRKRVGTCALTSDGWRGVPPGVNHGDSFCDRFSQLPTSGSRFNGDLLLSELERLLGWLRRDPKVGGCPTGP